MSSTRQPCSLCMELGEVLSDENDNKEVFRTCILCNKFMCEKHRSETDPDYCTDCLRSASSADFEKTETNFIDKNGKTQHHEGFRPIGDFWCTSAGAIYQADDSRLGQMLEFYSRKILDAQKVLDRNRTIKSMVSLEMEERVIERARSKRGIKITTPRGEVFISHEPTATPSSAATSSNGGAAKQQRKAAAAKLPTAADLITALKNSGITLEKIEAMIAAKAAVAKAKPEGTT